MASRPKPDFIDLGTSRHFHPSQANAPRDHPSPRSGDVPPALSPLDAFALQGRMLAAQFQDSDGKRISRLPPLTIANELAKPRPGYHSAPKSSGSSGDSHQTSLSPNSGEYEPYWDSPRLNHSDPKHRSYHPFIGNSDSTLQPKHISELAINAPGLEPVSEERSPQNHNFSAPRSDSPEDFVEQPHSSTRPATSSRVDFAPGPPQKLSNNESLNSNIPHNLAPPRSPAVPRSPRAPPSIKSLRNDSGDDSDSLSFQSDPYDLRHYERKPSNTSIRGRPRSPFSPPLVAQRSPSISSEFSVGDSNPTRRSINFSRPMSPANHMPKTSRPSYEQRPSQESSRLLHVEIPSARPSTDNISLRESIDSPHPIEPSHAGDFQDKIPENASRNDSEPSNGANSYIYTKYALPRGRKVISRSSIPAGEWLSHKFEWDEPQMQAEKVNTGDKPESAPQPAPRERGRFVEDFDHVGPPPEAPMHVSKISHSDILSTVPPVSTGGAKKTSRRRSKSLDASITPTAKSPQDKMPSLHLRRHKPSNSFDHEPPRLSVDKSRRKQRDPFETIAAYTPDQLSPETHLARGIACHESGALQKSTYHLRIAARAGLPTGMLLYALACRHGWGMRANPSEGVVWLRKAVDSSQVGLSDPEELLKTLGGSDAEASPEANTQAQRTHRAQLALAVYELGVSYMNGWGTAQDKSLALRCYEIAAAWGDGDALAEAGFCYAKGHGCKKNLHKAAGLYRKAEEKGISMAGNSW